MRLPLPLHCIFTLAARPPDTLIYPPQLQREPRPELLQPGPDTLDARHDLAIGSHDALFRLALLAEDVAMPSEEYVIALVVQRDDLSALQLGLRGEEREE
ncbi:uncharacterized protein L3040_004523 [Drepanopeziza brunnea f. sp. 'multigermtubi']|uniref:uncharacterized protein n=1 Tax=Drepanopeziza brunnea f. sp. 'multigermtubi' TaxID=698441 RepID=UPI00238E98B7|nr:hypothetical protein L3040_004523 [Drepanopeziza brunnea f. sp. 'multigermtubi']